MHLIKYLRAALTAALISALTFVPLPVLAAGPTVVQSTANVAANAGAGITFGSTPTPGNLIVAIVVCQAEGGSLSPGVNGWTYAGSSLEAFVGTSGSQIGTFYRYVQGGDTTAYSAPNTSNACFANEGITMAWEVNGAAATFATALDQGEASASSSSVAAVTTTAPNELALVAAGCYCPVFPSSPTFASPFTTVDAGINGTALYETVGSSHAAISSAGSCCSAAISTTTPAAYVLVTLKGVSATPSRHKLLFEGGGGW